MIIGNKIVNNVSFLFDSGCIDLKKIQCNAKVTRVFKTTNIKLLEDHMGMRLDFPNFNFYVFNTTLLTLKSFFFLKRFKTSVLHDMCNLDNLLKTSFIFFIEVSE